MNTPEIKDKIYWVGAIDWNIRDFHGYSTYKGTTYNAFLVKDEKIALFDTVKKATSMNWCTISRSWSTPLTSTT
jgi:flavorubredoxin